MNWFNDQIRTRIQADDTVFEESFFDAVGAVMGHRVAEAMSSDRVIARNAIEEILKYYHIRIEPEDERDGEEDIGKVLENVLRPHGIMTRQVNLDSGWYRDAQGAMLATRTDDGSVIALLPGRLGFGYTFVDVKTGKRCRLNRESAKLVSHEAIAFYRPMPLRPLTRLDFIRYLFSGLTVPDVVTFLLAMGAVTLVGMLSPVLVKWLTGNVIASGSLNALMAVGVCMISTSVGHVLFGVIKSLLSGRISTRISLSTEAAVMMRILSLPARFFRKYSAGELSNRSAKLCDAAEQITGLILTTSITSVFSLLYLGQVFAYGRALWLPALTVLIATLLITTVSSLMQYRYSRRIAELAAQESGMNYAVISGMQKIRLAGAEKRVFARWLRLYSREAALIYNPVTFLKISKVLVSAVSVLGSIALYAVAIRSDAVDPAGYYAFMTAFGMVSSAFGALAEIAPAVSEIRPSLEMAAPILEAQPEIAEDKEIVRSLRGAIELNSVSFRYDENMPLVLDDLSLKIRPGEYVAIVGKTGCGKSTLMRLLLGFEKPLKGAVQYDGKDLNHLDLKSLRSNIGSVMQNGALMQGDIFSNITISAPWLTLEDAWEAAETACIAEDIRNMPMGMFTVISEGQGGISGGQKQRLLIARAIAPKPKILILDEATSALDNITQKKISEALDRLKCTRIVIAHRLSTIRRCDRIIVLDGGKIIGDGTYDELIANNPFFASLVAMQRLDLEA